MRAYAPRKTNYTIYFMALLVVLAVVLAAIQPTAQTCQGCVADTMYRLSSGSGLCSPTRTDANEKCNELQERGICQQMRAAGAPQIVVIVCEGGANAKETITKLLGQ